MDPQQRNHQRNLPDRGFESPDQRLVELAAAQLADHVLECGLVLRLQRHSEFSQPLALCLYSACAAITHDQWAIESVRYAGGPAVTVPVWQRIRSGLRNSWTKLRSRPRREQVMLTLAVTYLLVYYYWIWQWPDYVRNEVIFQVGGILLTVEGLLIGLAFQIQDRGIRNWVAVGAGVPLLLLSVMTIGTASIQSIQFRYFSTSTATLLFKLQMLLFGLLVELYAIGILLSKQGRQGVIESSESSKDPVLDQDP